MTTWRERAHRFIATLDLPAAGDAKALRKIFRQHGHRFHGGTYWGRRAWGKAVRETLVARGLAEGMPIAVAAALPPDIIFPFREDRSCP